MKKILITGSLFIIVSFLLSSCLKDKSLTLNTDQSNSVTEFANTGTPAALPNNGASVRYAIDLGSLSVGDTTSFNVNVDYAGANKAPQDITVTIDLDSSLLETYNSVHSADGADYSMPPSSLFSKAFPMQITIPKGQLFGQVTLPVKLTLDYDFNASYALPLKITSTSVGDISGNFGEAIYSLNVRNIYDGEFKVTGTFVDLTNASFKSSYPKTIDLVTTGAKSNAYWDPNLNGGMFGYLFDAAGSGSYFGNFAPIFNFDDQGNVVSVSNHYGNATQNSSKRDAALDPDGVNKMTFDSNGKPQELNVSYFMLQAGSIRLKITEKFEYTGPRS
jgi:hypothetical protein